MAFEQTDWELASDYTDDEAALAAKQAAANAQSTADTAKTNAANAQSTADIAKTNASNAQDTADAAKNAATQTASDLSKFVTSTDSALDDMQGQIDGAITTWFYEVPPTNSNVPASNWTTTDAKNQHLGDVYYDTQTGYTYRWQVVSNTYSWQRITDVDVTKALADASKAQDTADSKRRVFTTTPTPPYDVGDLWVQGSTGDIMRCATAKAEGVSYLASDWAKASKYTDDTLAQSANEKAISTSNYFTHDTDGAHVGSVAGNPKSGRNLLMATGKIAFRDGEVEIGLIDVTTVDTRDLMRLTCGDDYDGILLDGGAYVMSKQHLDDTTYGAYESYVTCAMHEAAAPRASIVAQRGDGVKHVIDVEAELDVGVVGGKSYINTTADSFTYNSMHVRGQKTLWEGSWSSGSITVAGITAGQQLDVVVDGIVVHAAADSTDIAGVTTFYNIPSEDGVYRLGYIVLNIKYSGNTLTFNKGGYMCPSLAGDTVYSKVISKITLLR